MGDIDVRPLAEVPELKPTIQDWFEAEWPQYYGRAGRGDAARDLAGYCNAGSLPVGLVAFLQGEACGFAALKSEPFPTHPHLSPWAGAAYVKPPLRRRGIGQALFRSLEKQAMQLGHRRIYCATGTSASLLLRCGWQLLEVVPHEASEVGIYARAL